MTDERYPQHNRLTAVNKTRERIEKFLEYLIEDPTRMDLLLAYMIDQEANKKALANFLLEYLGIDLEELKAEKIRITGERDSENEEEFPQHSKLAEVSTAQMQIEKFLAHVVQSESNKDMVLAYLAGPKVNAPIIGKMILEFLGVDIAALQEEKDQIGAAYTKKMKPKVAAERSAQTAKEKF